MLFGVIMKTQAFKFDCVSSQPMDETVDIIPSSALSTSSIWML
jgi:hypothetical protein